MPERHHPVRDNKHCLPTQMPRAISPFPDPRLPVTARYPMHRIAPSFLLVLATSTSTMAATELTCSSAHECVAKANKALKLRQWATAEGYAGCALDWAEPEDATTTFVAGRLAAIASRADGRPRQALAWADAVVGYPGPYLNPTDRQHALESAVAYRRSLSELRPALRAQVDGLPEPSAVVGAFVKYAGRGTWNTLELRALPDGSLRWTIHAIRAGGSETPVRDNGPAQMFDDEGVAHRSGNRLSIVSDSPVDTAEAACAGTIDLTPGRATVAMLDNCEGTTAPAFMSGKYVWVERTPM